MWTRRGEAILIFKTSEQKRVYFYNSHKKVSLTNRNRELSYSLTIFWFFPLGGAIHLPHDCNYSLPLLFALLHLCIFAIIELKLTTSSLLPACSGRLLSLENAFFFFFLLTIPLLSVIIGIHFKKNN